MAILLYGLALLAWVWAVGHFLRLLGQAAALSNDRELLALERPADLAGFPAVTVIIPARNEQRNIGPCLEALLAVDYPRLRVIVADDGSTDDTAELVTVTAAGDPRVSLFSPRADPEARQGWVSGKSFVLWHASQAVEAAEAPWLLFLDADTRVHPDALWRVMAFVKRHELSAFSGSGIYRNPTLLGDLLESLLYTVVFLWMPLRAILRDDRPDGWLNGQLILIDQPSYVSVGGHRAVRGFAFDDLSFGHHLKRHGVRYRFLPSAQLFGCLNYTSLREAMTGWERLLAGGTPWIGLGRGAFAAMLGELVFVWLLPPLLVGLMAAGALAVPTTFGAPLFYVLGGQVLFVLVMHALNRAAMRVPVLPSLLYPLAAMLAFVAIVRGYGARFRAKAFAFRGRVLQPDEREARGEAGQARS